MLYPLLKSLHIIFVVTWFAGLFYIVRLFIYHSETNNFSEPDKSILQKQYTKMEYLLWNVITQPSMFITLIMGLWLAINLGFFDSWNTLLSNYWLLVKLSFVFLLILYHLSCYVIFNQLQKGEIRYTTNQLRLWNEVATLLLVAIVFLVVYKDSLSAAKGLIGFAGFTVVLFLLVKLAKRLREEGKH